MYLNKTIALLVILCMVFAQGCTTLKDVSDTSVPLDQLLETGDHIIVYEHNGQIVDMRFVVLDGDVIRGSLTSNGLEVVTVNVNDIEKMEMEKIHGGLTTAAVIGGIVLLPIAAMGVGMSIADQ